jgi:rubrerythrin
MTGGEVSLGLIVTLGEARAREKEQALFYRSLAASAEDAGLPVETERLNELHADEQHHLSRLTARLLELGGTPDDLRQVGAPRSSLEGWEAEARRREGAEVGWYEERLGADLDERTRALFEEILASERKHREELGGKWMSA